MDQTFYDPKATTPLPIPQLNPAPKSNKPKWLITLLLVVFPPLAMYYMYTDETYHRWFAKTNISIGVSMLLLLIPEIIFVTPKLSSLYSSLPVKNPLPFVTQISEVTSVLFFLIVIISIWALRMKKEDKEYKLFLNCMLILLIASFLLSAYVTDVILTELFKPIYDSVGTAGNIGL